MSLMSLPLPSLPDGTIVTPDLLRRMQEQATGDLMRQQDSVGNGVKQSAISQIQTSTLVIGGIVILGFGIGYAMLDKMNRL